MLRKLARFLVPVMLLDPPRGVSRKLMAMLFAFTFTAVAQQTDAAQVPRTERLFSGTAGAVAAVDEPVRLAGHGLSLGNAVASSSPLPASLTVTLTFRRDDEDGFQKFLHEVYDPQSPQFHRFLTQAQIAERFGPSKQAYETVVKFLRAQNLVLTGDSPNRLTLTVTGVRADVERAFAVHIDTYTLGKRSFFANADAPSLPADIAARVSAIQGLSNLAQPTRIGNLDEKNPYAPKSYDEDLALTCKLADAVGPVDAGVTVGGAAIETGATGFSLSFVATFLNYQCAADELNLVAAYAASAGGSSAQPASGDDRAASTTSVASILPGSGQKVGLLEFAAYHSSDVQDFLNMIGHPERLAQLSNVTVSGGVSQNVSEESEVLLDIDTVMVAAPGANVIVYEGGFSGGGSFQSMLNAMVNGGVDVISNSWAYCENQTTLADVQSLDSILQSAAASGITVVSGAGDSGSTCLDGSANTLAVPADAPHVTAVGGTTAAQKLLGTYGTETWWDGTLHTPPTGQGGFGLSQYFARPPYQDALNVQAMRSVPDVTAPADPAQGVFICQADNGGCPNFLLYGGTSYAAPTWGAFVAVLNQRMGHDNGFLNPALYPLANGSAFHSAASMGSDFAHVGLGSPNLSEVQRVLQGNILGSVSTANSAIAAYPSTLVADGASHAGVAVVLLDANFYTVSGQSVSLAANPGSSAVISALNSTSDNSNGAARFTVTDTVAETVTLTATTGTGQLAQTAQVTFVGPPAAFASIGALPTTVTANGSSTSTITITLQDANHVGTPKKQVTISQGTGRAKITGPTPALTDSSGQVTFAASDTFTEDVTFSAIDVTDGNLPVPGSAMVSFTSGSGSACNIGAETPAAGYQVTSVVTGFTPDSNCVGVSGIAWDPQGNMYAINYGFGGGDLYRFPAGSLPSVADAGTRLTATPYASGTCTHGLAFSKDGTHLYLARQFCGSGGDVVEISTVDGHIIRSVAPANSIPCATGVATDPISGDLFVATPCGPQQMFRIANPDSATPGAPVVYSASGWAIGLNFTPDGTLWTEGYFGSGQIIKISGTNAVSPGTATPLAAAPAHAGGVLPEFNPADLATPAGLLYSDGVAATSAAGSVKFLDLTQDPAAVVPVASGGVGQLFVVAGPDGCAYVSNSDRIDRISAADGSCNFTLSSAAPHVVLSPTTVNPNPLQGTAQAFNAQLFNVGVPAGQPVVFSASGANDYVQLVDADASGAAQFAYIGAMNGTDTVRASMVVGGVTYVSNAATVTWSPGKHTTALTINNNPAAAGAGSSITVSATLLDLSTNPFTAVSGATVQFSLAGNGCSGSTDVNGTVSCLLTASVLTQCTLTANYAGDSSYLPATAVRAFSPSAGVIFVNGFEVPKPGCL